MPSVTIPPEVELRAKREEEGRRRFRAEFKRPIQFIYVGIALLLGGCVLSLLLALVRANDTALGFAFLCTVPIGFILFVIGFILSLSRREGRLPKGPK